MTTFRGQKVYAMYTTDRQTDVRHKHRLMPPPVRGRGIIIAADEFHI